MRTFFLLVAFLSLCGCTSAPSGMSFQDVSCDDYLNKNLCVKMNHREGGTSFLNTGEIEIFQDSKLVLLIQQSVARTDVIYFADGKAVKFISYDIWGKEVAKCIVTNDIPSGTVWHISLGVNGLKRSSIITYKNGDLISEEPYKENEIVELLEQLGKSYRPKNSDE